MAGQVPAAFCSRGWLTVRAFFLVSKVVDVLVEDVVHPGTGDHPAAALYSEGRRSLDPDSGMHSWRPPTT
jgi:hypothetical protein